MVVFISFRGTETLRTDPQRPSTSTPTNPPTPGTVLSNRITTLTGLLVSKGEFFLFKKIRIDRLGHSITPSKGSPLSDFGATRELTLESVPSLPLKAHCNAYFRLPLLADIVANGST